MTITVWKHIPYGWSWIYKAHQYGDVRKIYFSSEFEPWIFIVKTFKHKQSKGKLSIAGYMIISEVRKMDENLLNTVRSIAQLRGGLNYSVKRSRVPYVDKRVHAIVVLPV